MFRVPRHALKIVAVLCVTALLVVYSMRPGNLDLSPHEGEDIQHDVASTELLPHLKTNEVNTTWNALMSLVNLDQHTAIVRNFYVCLSSICKHTSIAIKLHVVTDSKSQSKADRVLKKLKKDLCKDKVDVVYHNISVIEQALKPFMSIFEDFFTNNAGSYFTGALFFLSTISHLLFPKTARLIILDADLKFRVDIRKLFNKFDEFSSRNLIGIAHEQQPVYKHITHRYQNHHPHTKVGAPPPDGNPGFNSGVLLMDLARLRNSALYKGYLADPSRLRLLAEKYYFRGHLGDQGFYTLLSFEHPELFYVLPCTWNRQLCIWWKDKGYEEIFHLYHNCDGYVNVYHGNCGTAIPDD